MFPLLEISRVCVAEFGLHFKKERIKNMQVTDIKINKIVERKSKILAHSDITLDNLITIRQIMIIEGNNGPFIDFPSRKIGEDYLGLVEVEDQLFKDIKEEILAEYQRIIDES